ncbi:MAG: hypothetical protein AB4042_00210 [Leptolyngbyaceae cyanobacterium]
MTQKILFEGWDDLSGETQEAMQAWLQATLDSNLAGQRFLDIFLSHHAQNFEDLSLDLNSNFAEGPLVIVSSVQDEENAEDGDSFISIDKFSRMIVMQNCYISCLGKPPSEQKQCLCKCRGNCEEH